jgi:proline iminopeptidase
MRSFKHANASIYVPMQGPSELGASGKLERWDITDRLSLIEVPVLTVGGTHDTMDPEHMKWIAGQVRDGSYLHCPQGSHLAIYDDQQRFFSGVIEWLQAHA